MASVAEAEAERSSIIEWRMAGAVEVDIERTVREAGPLAEGVGSVDELSKLSNWVPSNSLAPRGTRIPTCVLWQREPA